MRQEGYDNLRASVALISMPFHQCMLPPLGLGLLKSALSAARLPSTVYNFNLDLLPEMGETAEESVAADAFLSRRILRNQVGEWIFAPPDSARDEAYLALLREDGFGPEMVALTCRLRSRIDEFVLRWAHRVVAAGHDIVGFASSMGRTRANVRLAEAIRRLAPATQTIVGGFAASGDMGRALLEAFPVFDLVCHTEAEELIVPIVRALRGEPGHVLEELCGISYRDGDGSVVRTPDAPLPDIERTPLPDYGDYFEQADALRRSWDSSHELPFWVPTELARGCWWGARQHCTFCSDNGDRMAFRSKSPERALLDFDALHARYGVRRFMAVDNIVAQDYYRTLLPRLGERRDGYSFFWEVRPTLGQAEAATLAKAGVVQVQPGIESLSTPVLRLMRKGTSGIDNINALKWLAAYGIDSSWSILFSLPGERPGWYEEMARVIPRLMHLTPPRGPTRVTLGRFSPMYLRSLEMGVKVLGPSAYDRMVFGDVRLELLDRLVCELDYEIGGRPSGLDALVVATIGPLLARWRESFATRGCTLSIVDGPGESLVVEGPLLRPDRVVRMRGLLRRCLKGCESPTSERLLLERLAGDEGEEAGREAPLAARAYRELVEELCFTGVRPEEAPPVSLSRVVEVAEERGWAYRESGRILSLPVDQTHFVKSDPFQLQAAYRRFQEP